MKRYTCKGSDAVCSDFGPLCCLTLLKATLWLDALGFTNLDNGAADSAEPIFNRRAILNTMPLTEIMNIVYNVEAYL